MTDLTHGAQLLGFDWLFANWAFFPFRGAEGADSGLVFAEF